MSLKNKNILSSFDINEHSEEGFADILVSESELVIKNPELQLKVHINTVYSEFEVGLYDINANIDEDEEVDGGIVSLGDALDAIIYAKEFFPN